MKTNYPLCYKEVRQFEGGNDDDPKDHGGRTSRGIIQREWDVYRRTHPGRPADVWQASEADIGAIYHDGEYWMGQFLDDCFSGGDETLFDYGVNSGPGRSQKVLRRCLHLPDNALRSDVNAAIARLGQGQLTILVTAICDERLAFLQHLNQPRFLGGWTKRVKRVKTVSLSLVTQAISVPDPETHTDEEKTGMNKKGQHPDPTGAKKVIVGTGAGGTAAAGSGFWDWVTHHQALSVVAAVAVVSIIAFVIYQIDQWHERRKVAPPPGWAPPPELKPATQGA